MSTQFARLFKRSGVGPLTEFFGELVYFVPKDGNERPVRAIIERDVEVFERVPVRADIMRVKMCGTHGIASINTGGDGIRYAKREGDEPTLTKIKKVISTDNGFIQFQMQ